MNFSELSPKSSARHTSVGANLPPPGQSHQGPARLLQKSSPNPNSQNSSLPGKWKTWCAESVCPGCGRHGDKEEAVSPA